MDNIELIKFYESNLELLQILKSIRKRSIDFYNNFKVSELKDELSLTFFEMNKAEICNNLPVFFFNLQKQIEIIIDYSIKNKITMEKLRNNSMNHFIPNDDGSEIPIGCYFFNFEYPPAKEDTSKKYLIKKSDKGNTSFKVVDSNENFNEYSHCSFGEWSSELKKQFQTNINGIQFQKIAISNKINIFYCYFICSKPYEKNEKGYSRRTWELNYTITNTVLAFRNLHSHGNAELTPNQKKLIQEAISENKSNQYTFYDKYYKTLEKLVSSFIIGIDSSKLLID